MDTPEQQTAAATPTTLRERLTLIPIGEKGIAPKDIDDIFRLAKAISISKICPPGFSETDCFVVIATGLEIGLAPFTAIQNMYIVNNRANLFGDIALGIVRATGLLEDYKQEYFGKQYEDDYGCRVTSKRKGMSVPIVTEYKVKNARIAGKWDLYHYTKNGDKIPSPWVTDPDRMLLFRARGFNLRDNFGDILKGCGVDTEEGEVLPGFEHAKAAVGRTVEPHFAGQAEPAKRGPGRPRKRISEAEESPKGPAGDDKPAGPMAKAPEMPVEAPALTKLGLTRTGDEYDPQPEPTPAPEKPAGLEPGAGNVVLTEGLTPGGRVGPETKTTVAKLPAELFPRDPKTESTALTQVMMRLKSDEIPVEKFLEVLFKFGYVQADDVEEIRAGHVGIEKCEPKAFEMALQYWKTILEEVKRL